MNKLHFIQNITSIGFTTFSVISLINTVDIAPAQAADFSCELEPIENVLLFETTNFDNILGIDDRVFCGDKIFSNFSFDDEFSEPPDSVFAIELNQFAGPLGNYITNWESDEGLILLGTGSAQYSYDVAINFNEIPAGGLGDNFLAEEGTVFDIVAIDTEVDVIANDIFVTKDVIADGQIFTVTSDNGNTDIDNLPEVTFIEVTDTLSWGTNDPTTLQEIFALQNEYLQEVNGTPEPTTILGFLTASILGLTIKRKK